MPAASTTGPENPGSVMVSERNSARVQSVDRKFCRAAGAGAGSVLATAPGAAAVSLARKKGAAIIYEGGKFVGRLIADRIIVAGKVGDVTLAAKDSALLIAGEELRIGSTADVHGVLRAPSTVTAKGAKLNSSVIKSMLVGG